MNSELKIPLRVTNLVMTGKLPIQHKLDFRRFINDLDEWYIVNDEKVPIAQKHFERNDGTRSIRRGRKCNITVSIWNNGSINIVGLRSTKEGEKTLDKIVKELQTAGIL